MVLKSREKLLMIFAVIAIVIWAFDLLLHSTESQN